MKAISPEVGRSAFVDITMHRYDASTGSFRGLVVCIKDAPANAAPPTAIPVTDNRKH